MTTTENQTTAQMMRTAEIGQNALAALNAYGWDQMLADDLAEREGA